MATISAAASAQHLLPYGAPETRAIAISPTASSFAYPQSIFVDSQSGNIWVTDFDNNRVLRFDVSALTDVAGPSAIAVPGESMLGQNYPNPFNPGTRIGFRVPGMGSGWVRLVVYDLLGREVAVLVDEPHSPGNYEVRFDGSGRASGVYIYRLTVGSAIGTRRMLLVN
jgi:hypothetical protein